MVFATDMDPIGAQIWDMKYRFKAADGSPIDNSIEDTWDRVASALAEAETIDTRDHWQGEFRSAMEGFRFMPAGRILAGAGTSRNVTLFNCFVMGTIGDDLTSIFDHLGEAAKTMQAGGGIGYDFSTLRPRGALVKSVGADASGPLSFMDVWDAMCRTIMSAGMRRGAMMATLRCDHPDIEDFVAAKRQAGRLSNFNLSVLVTDPFIEAVRADADWPLVFEGREFGKVSARALWDKIMTATYEYAEPGVIFIDRINAANNLSYCETISATNPCGEQPLPPYGACLLGSVNLAALVDKPFEANAGISQTELADLVSVAVRMLDNAIDVSKFPLSAQEREAKAKRRIGLGVTGLADALIMCGLTYGSDEAAQAAKAWMAQIERAAYLASAELAKEKGAYPAFDADAYLARPKIAALEPDVQAKIAQFGIRNALLTSIAPTGTISLLAGNVSSGIEPVFSFTYKRKILDEDGAKSEEDVSDFAYRCFVKKFGIATPLPDHFVNAQTLSPEAHLTMQAALQAHVDSSISKTINVPESIEFDDFKDIYMTAFDLGLKGCTTYRPNDITGSVLSTNDEPKSAQEAGAASGENAVMLPKALTGEKSANIVYLSEPQDREKVLPGFTYKLKWPESDHAIYITLNDVIEEGRRRPFEIFINSKNMEHYAWTVALTRMISAVFRRGGDVSFVVEELKAVFDPRGGQWMKQKYVPSLLAAIGDIIEQHMIDTGFLAVKDNSQANREETGALRYCPKCHQPSLRQAENCQTCLSCGHSRCS